MKYRRLGRTNLAVSSVGLGTNQLRLVPYETAIDTLRAGFAGGVNFVHVSADYEGAEAVVAEAIRRHEEDQPDAEPIICAINAFDVHGSGDAPAAAFAGHFERSCEIFGRDRLPMYGIAAMEDREALGENVWGPGGMVEYLQQLKRDGRVDHLFCTSHGDPAFVQRMIDSDVFDAIMLSYTPLGFHLLSLEPRGAREFESVARNRMLFRRCRDRDIGVMVMMPLAGGLLVPEKGIPPTHKREPSTTLTAGIVLRAILEDADVTSVMPGVTSVEEATENAAAGAAEPTLSEIESAALDARIAELQTTICSRCGACEDLCSQQLPVSWLFRAAEMAEHPAESFETWSDVEYFALHPQPSATCASCPDVTCACPYGLDIPVQLTRAHERMTTLMENAQVPPAPGDPRADRGTPAFGSRVLRLGLTDTPDATGANVIRVHLENTGDRPWSSDHGTELVATVDETVTRAAPRWTAHRGGRAHFVIELPPETLGADNTLVLTLTDSQTGTEPVEIFRGSRSAVNGLHASPGVPMTATDSAKPPTPSPYGVSWPHHNLPESWPEDSVLQLYVEVRNEGTRTWHRHAPADTPGLGTVQLVVTVDGDTVSMTHLPHNVAPGETAIVGTRLVLPNGMGGWNVECNLVEQGVAWFAMQGVRPLVATIDRDPAESVPGQAALHRLTTLNPTHYLPTEGVPRSRSGRPYPLIVTHAQGARIADGAGTEWIDYAMGWGSSLLGHAHPEIMAAVADSLKHGGITSLPHTLESEVSKTLCDLFPSAEMVLFGKNGSDACTAAARVARVATGRRKILFSGFHGWQDPFAEAFEPALAGPGSEDMHRFRLNDLTGLVDLLKAHGPETAAVMMEPAAQVEGVDGPVRDADPKFLAEAADLAREAGALLIFDEIMTGFRYRQGSVQAATGVTPDLTCLGKGLSAGMPLSALVGRRKILEPAFAQLFYHPTFKSEVHSFAAANAALDLYRRIDVWRHIQRFGNRLRGAVNELSEEVGVGGRLVGPPFRMVYRFNDRDPRTGAWKRTLLQQGLLEHGVMTFRGFMLPSLAHGDAELDETVDAFRAALSHVRDVSAAGSYARALEIPLVV